MAETIGAFIIASAFGEAAAGFTIGATSISLGAITGSALALAGSIGLQLALEPKAPKQPKPGDGNISIRQTNPVRQGVYGRARVAGGYCLYEVNEVSKTISIDVLALVGGQICCFRKFYFNDDPITLGTAGVRGESIIADETPDGRYSNGVSIDWRHGFDREVPYQDAVDACPSSWTLDHRGDGIASLLLSSIQAADVNNQTKIYPNGKPEPSAVIDGYPLWDPRDSAQDPDDRDSFLAYPTYDAATTYAAGARVIFPGLSKANAYSGATTYARWDKVRQNGVDYYSRVDGNLGTTPGTNTAKWIAIGTPYYSRVDGNLGNAPDVSGAQWTSVIANPVLQLMDFLTDSDHGMGLPRSSLIEPVVAALMAKAELCDALVVDKHGTYGVRYSSNGKFNFDDDPADVVSAILASCDGFMAEDGEGALALEVGVYVAPTVTLEAKHILAFAISYGTADEQKVNELTLNFIDPGNKYSEVPGQPWRDEDDISRRGKTRSQSLSLACVDRHSQARRIAKRAMARLSAPHGTLKTTLYGLQALGRRWVILHYPFLADVADCVVELSRAQIDLMAGTVTFDWLLIDPATIDAWDAATEEGEGPGENFGAIIDDALNELVDDFNVAIVQEGT